MNLFRKIHDSIIGKIPSRIRGSKFFLLGLITLALPITLLLTKQIQDTRQRASSDSSIVGTVQHIQGDDFEKNEKFDSYILTKSDGEEVSLALTDKQKSLVRPGAIIEYNTNAPEEKQISTIKESTSKSLATTQTIEGNYKLPIILVNFTNSPQHSVTKETINNEIVNSIAKYISNTSNGIASVQTQVYGWYTIPPPPNNASCYSTTDWIRDAVAAADPEVDFTDTDRFLIIYSGTSQCSQGAGALGPFTEFKTNEGPRNMAFSYISFRVEYAQEQLTLEVLRQHSIHEVLHTFGLLHAKGLNCEAGKSPTSDECLKEEYADAHDVMGSYNQGTGGWHLNAPHLASLGWLKEPQLQTVTSSGNYTITPLEVKDNKVKALRILRRKEGPFPQYLYIEFRQPIQPDIYDTSRFPSQAKTSVYDGALIHLDGLDIGFPNQKTSISTYLVDASPNSPLLTSPYNTALTLGQTLTDPLSGASITVSSKTSDLLNVEISFPQKVSIAPTQMTTPTPTLLPSPIPSLTVSKLPPCNQFGDATLDGFVSNDDVSLVLKYVAGLVKPSPIQFYNVDVDNSGTLTASDTQLIKAYAQGAQTTFPACSIKPTPPYTPYPSKPYPSPSEYPITPYPTLMPSWTTPAPTKPSNEYKCDFNRDGALDKLDYNIWLKQFINGGKPQSSMSADCDKNGKVDIFDYNLGLREQKGIN